MKRIYKNNDAIFNLTSNGYPFDINTVNTISFNFYTTNDRDIITKSEIDIKDGVLILKWKELEQLEEGVLFYDYVLDDGNVRTSYHNTSDYYIVSGRDIDIPSGEYATKDDLNQKQDKLVSGLNIATINNQDITKGGNIVITSSETPDLSEYAKKTDIPKNTSDLNNDSNFITQIPSNYVTDEKLQGKGYLTEIPKEYITETELTQKNYVDSSTLDSKGYINEIPSNYVTDEKLQGKGYLTEIPKEYITETELTQKNYVDSSTLDSKGYINEIPSNYVTDEKLTEKTSTLATKEEVTKKQDTLVSGSNIATINGQSLLEGKNIVIEGGSGGSEKSGLYGFEIIDGDLYLVTEDATEANNFSIDSNGDLIYEIPNK